MTVYVFSDGWSAEHPRRLGLAHDVLFTVENERDLWRLFDICPGAREEEARIRALAGGLKTVPRQPGGGAGGFQIHCVVCQRGANVSPVGRVWCPHCGSRGTWNGGHDWTVTHNGRGGGAQLGALCQTARG